MCAGDLKVPPCVQNRNGGEVHRRMPKPGVEFHTGDLRMPKPGVEFHTGDLYVPLCVQNGTGRGEVHRRMPKPGVEFHTGDL
eukprot:365009-Chlamydomonas_euryale.AAC.10